MCPYKRAKREDAIRPSQKEMSIKIGSWRDSFESLQGMCNDKANELIKSIELKDGEEMEVIFWTADFVNAKLDINSSPSNLHLYDINKWRHIGK